MKLDRLYPLSHSPIYFHFKQTPADFVVTEIPLYDFTGNGEHLILKIRKKALTTWQMLEILSNHLGIRVRDIGYAGLKDKDAMTIQYVSINRKYEDALKSFSHEQIKILETTYHNNKLRIGHLKGNRFFIRLKKVNPTDAKKIDSLLKWISQNGSPNYFGYQRFGRDGDNYEIAREIVEGKRKMRDRKRREFLMSAYQSHLFNLWLSKRIEISRLFEGLNPKELKNVFVWNDEIINLIHKEPHFFKILPGDVASHYPYGKLFVVDDLEADAKRIYNREISPTGLLSGKKAKQATGIAWEIEKEFIEDIPAQGSRRYAWIWPENIEGDYKQEVAHYELHFTLPKGAYATVLLEMIANRPIRE
ncbi:tRNA pseudouridine(13) synthase TruD [Hydrogenimonas thermophila]|uniref:tRNA pseudouridine(13) synthase TruD n=1 Tax=Hydrogenimonas thermophila TaxID=223786 RepID=UPI0029371FAE|nr:tRNA pseudouridine(13) synthase TruD [Hydrogenimonas thermophila]WOE68990.1 tRNA pseudouridine(13) synthase TruD [Hydrogenimonas thermophila]WOE71498.1 tRNA pseudouridine(13) synthase TruD [Hydrogenimonas thermophila]